MNHFTKAAMVSVLALGLVTACGQNAAQDYDGAVVQPDQVETTAAEIATQVAQENQSPSFITSTDANGNVKAAFVNERVMTQDHATRLVQGGQLSWKPINEIMQANDSEFQLQAVNQQGQQGQVQQQNFNSGAYNTVQNQTVYTRNNGSRAVRLRNNVQYTRGQLRTAVTQNIVYSTTVSQFFEIRYVSVPMFVQQVVILPQQFFVPTQTFSYDIVQSCVQNLGGVYVQSTCYRPMSVTANVSWQLAVSCSVPVATVPVSTGGQYTIQNTGYQQQYPTTNNNGSFVQVFL